MVWRATSDFHHVTVDRHPGEVCGSDGPEKSNYVPDCPLWKLKSLKSML